MYGLAQSALNNAKSLQKMAEHEFATALNDVDTTLWEKTLTSLIDQLNDTFPIPNALCRRYRALSAHGLI